MHEFDLSVLVPFVTGSKYPEPMMGAGPGFQARIAEMAQMEVETIRYEKTKKTKKKSSSS